MLVSIYGRQFEVEPEPADFWGWVARGNYNGEWQALEKLLRPEHTFLDLGAWVGSHSLFASTIAHKVVAVEPDPVALAILKANVLHKGTDISICMGAIAGHDGMITLGSGFLGASTTRANKNEGGGIGPWVEGQTFETNCCTLRTFLEQVMLPRPIGPLFIKMDIEGGEEAALADTALFEEHKPTLYLETHPFWWRNAPRTWDSIRMLAGKYKQVLNLQLETADLNSEPRQLIFTDE